MGTFIEIKERILVGQELADVVAMCNVRQRNFARNYPLCQNNGTEAAKAAGYSDKTATVQASTLLGNPNVVTLTGHYIALAAQQTEIDTVQVLKELGRVGFSNIKDFVKWKGNVLTVKDSDDIPSHLTACIQEITKTEGPYGTTIKIKLYSKLDALGKIGQYLKMFSDKFDLPDRPEDDRTLEEIQSERLDIEGAIGLISRN